VDFPIFIAWWIFPVCYVNVYQRISLILGRFLLTSIWKIWGVTIEKDWNNDFDHETFFGQWGCRGFILQLTCTKTIWKSIGVPFRSNGGFSSSLCYWRVMDNVPSGYD
jgi:hypothetical protein